jgi:hypothetical protein
MTTFELTPFFNQPPHAFFSGLVGSAEGVGNEVVQIGDHWYLLDLASDRFRVASIPAMKPQQDDSARPGEQSLSNEGLWRRNISTWHHGAGQTWYDRDDANPFQFRTSRGVDPFTRWTLDLLNDTEIVVTDADGWTSMAIGVFDTNESRLVVAGNNGRAITIDDAGNITEILGLTGNTFVASSGSTVYIADTTGIYPVNAAGTGIGAAFNANIDGAKIWFAKDRLWAAVGADLYNVIDAATTTPHHTHPWPGWQWTSVNEGGEFIYATGFSGDRGRVYSMGIDQDATTVLPPLVALPLPDGEVPYSVAGYIGLVAVGTNLGLRVTQPEGPSLISGPIVGFDLHEDHTHPVRCIEGQDSFLWFGQDSLFSDGSGLGRVDLRTFLPDQTLAPAYATDLMADGVSGVVHAVATFDSRRWFVVGNSIYRETDTLVAEGYLDTGRITMNVTDHKVAVYIDLRHDALPTGSAIDVYENTASLALVLRGTSNVPLSERPSEVFSTNHNRTVWHEVRVVLRQTGGSSPGLSAITLAAQPVPDRSFNWFLPLLLHETVTYVDQEFSYDVPEEYAYLSDLSRTQRLVRVRLGKLNNLGFVEDFEWVPHQPRQDGEFFNGTMVVKIKTAEVTR